MAATPKLLNDGEAAVDEMLEGVLAAHADKLTRPAPRAIPIGNRHIPERWHESRLLIG